MWESDLSAQLESEGGSVPTICIAVCPVGRAQSAFAHPQILIYSPLFFRIQRRRYAAHRRMAKQPAHLVGGGEQLCHVDAGRNPHALQHVDHVLGCDIAGRAGRERAAAEPAGRAIDHANALLHPGVEIGQRLAVGVVEMHGEIGDRHGAGDRAQHLPWP